MPSSLRALIIAVLLGGAMFAPFPIAVTEVRAASATTSPGSGSLATSPATATEGRARSATSNACPKTGAKVVINAAGAVTLNGAAIAVEKLGATLSALSPRPTEVCYFREKTSGEPPPSVRTAVSAIISAHLPISFYSDASFANRVAAPTR